MFLIKSCSFHNGSKYDFHFIIKELANAFDGQFEFIGENSEKYKTFSISIKKKLIDKEGNKTTKIIPYKVKFINSIRFMATSLLNLVDNLMGESINLNVKSMVKVLMAT